MTPVEGRPGERRSGQYMGLCDGCEQQTVQPVRDVSGPWGAATVCRRHQTETD